VGATVRIKESPFLNFCLNKNSKESDLFLPMTNREIVVNAMFFLAYAIAWSQGFFKDKRAFCVCGIVYSTVDLVALLIWESPMAGISHAATFARYFIGYLNERRGKRCDVLCAWLLLDYCVIGALSAAFEPLAILMCLCSLINTVGTFYLPYKWTLAVRLPASILCGAYEICVGLPLQAVLESLVFIFGAIGLAKYVAARKKSSGVAVPGS